MCFSLLYSIIGSNWAGGPISWCHPLKLPYNVIQSIFSFSPRWCHLPKRRITSPYGKKWCHERPYAPTQTSSTQWCHLPKWRMTSHPRRLRRYERPSTPPTPLRMRPGVELSVSYYLFTLEFLSGWTTTKLSALVTRWGESRVISLEWFLLMNIFKVIFNK